MKCMQVHEDRQMSCMNGKLMSLFWGVSGGEYVRYQRAVWQTSTLMEDFCIHSAEPHTEIILLVC